MKPPSATPATLGEAAEGSKVTILDRGERRPAVVTGRYERLVWVRFLVNGAEAAVPSPMDPGTPLAA